MTIESVRAYIADDLSKLPEGHPDRPFLEAQTSVFSAYLDAHSLPSDVAKSTDLIEQKEGETRANYLRRKYQALSEISFNDVPLTKFTPDTFQGEADRLITNAFEFLKWHREVIGMRSTRNNSLATHITLFYIQNERDILEQTGLSDLEKTPIKELGLSTRPMNCLRRGTGGYRNSDEYEYFAWSDLVVNNNRQHLPSAEEAGALAMRTRDELSDLRNLGLVSIQEIEKRLSSLGLTLAGPAIDHPLDK